MNNFRYPVTGLVLFAVLISLSLIIYNGLTDEYGITDEYVMENNFEGNIAFGEEQNIVEMLNSIQIIDGMNNIAVSIVELKQPTGSAFDIVGALASAAVGILQAIMGLFTFPFEIGTIILKFYHFPEIVIIGFNIMMILFAGFIMVSAYLRYRI